MSQLSWIQWYAMNFQHTYANLNENRTKLLHIQPWANLTGRYNGRAYVDNYIRKTERYSWRIARTWKKNPYIMLNYYIVCCWFFLEWAFVQVRRRQRKRNNNDDYWNTLKITLVAAQAMAYFPPYTHNTSISTDDVKKLQA